ncbi:hypothetical protein CYMTET_26048 [Cymbomonas tetramitiformis]|uniref:Uncharacterized protein n=1 Tax=Cymbomonas tetramitiformis TaxID=36881 RepID=A0AAE0KYJ9_9CHLO|nr:hypothetical protein CYMTET_26048 [Cymbomonas tetramitiformis]
MCTACVTGRISCVMGRVARLRGVGIPGALTGGPVAQDGRTPLHFAVMYGHIETAERLLQHGARVDVSDKNKPGKAQVLHTREVESPFSIAITAGHLDMAEMLLEHGADVEAACQRASVQNWLCSKCHSDDIDIMRKALTMMPSAANAAQTQDDGESLFGIAITAGHLDMAEMLLEHGADVEAACQRASVQNWLCSKCHSGDIDIMRKALTMMPSAANAAQTQGDGESLFGIAITAGHLDMAEMLLEHGADVEAACQRASVQNWLCSKCHSGDIDIMRKALTMMPSAANAAQTQGDGESLFGIAITAGHLDMAEMLLEHGADVEAACQRASVQNWLCSKCHSGDIDIMRKALTMMPSAANAAQTQGDGESLFGIAITAGHLDMAEMLLEHGADVERPRVSDGKFPLQLVYEKEQWETFVRLLRAPFHLSAASIREVVHRYHVQHEGLGRTLLWHTLVMTDQYKEIVEVLASQMSSLRAVQDEHQRPAYAIASSGMRSVLDDITLICGRFELLSSPDQADHRSATCLVYRAVDRPEGTEVVLKLMKQEDQFLREIKSRNGLDPAFVVLLTVTSEDPGVAQRLPGDLARRGLQA